MDSRPTPGRARRLAVLLALLSLCAPAPALADAGKAREAAAISHVAHTKAKAGEYVLAAQLYEQAYTTDPKVPGYLFSAARCLHKAGRLDAAEALYYRVLGKLGAQAELANTTRSRIAEVRAARRVQQKKADAEKAARDKAAAAAKANKAAAAAKANKAAAAARRNARSWWSLHGTDAALVGGGLGIAAAGAFAVLLPALDDAAALEAELADKRASDGLVYGLDRDAALSQQADANRGIGVGVGLIAAGATCAALGTWWLLRADPEDADKAASIRLLPAGRGAVLRVGF